MGLHGSRRKLAGSAEINQHDLVAILAQNQVLGFDIPVQQAKLMYCGERGSHLADVANGDRFRQRFGWRYQFVQGLAWNIVHYQKRQTIFDKKINHPNNAGMGTQCQAPTLCLELLLEVGKVSILP
jgi:hypothetical protein